MSVCASLPVVSVFLSFCEPITVSLSCLSVAGTHSNASSVTAKEPCKP